MEEKIVKIIRKIREIGKYNPDIKEIVEQNAYIKISEKKGKLVLSSIEFCWYDTLVVCEKSIILHKEHGNNKVICQYSNWDDFLNM